MPVATAGARPCAASQPSTCEVVVGEHRAAHRRDEDGPLADAQLVDGLREQLVDDAVAAARAVVVGPVH